ncbi:MAG: Thioredoxin [Parcubacteria group bacterium GW2011_GWE2_38_18]|nr:MAG: Thioredoxin [Parcubacteria group bacterium GW2011_GWE2_38_18]
MSKVIILTDQNFEQEVLKSELPVLVDFWAPWCGPCKMMAPVLDDLSNDFNGKMSVAKLDVDNPAHQAIAGKYQIQSIPALKLFKNGQVVKDYVGYRDKNTFASELNLAL